MTKTTKKTLRDLSLIVFGALIFACTVYVLALLLVEGISTLSATLSTYVDDAIGVQLAGGAIGTIAILFGVRD